MQPLATTRPTAGTIPVRRQRRGRPAHAADHLRRRDLQPHAAARDPGNRPQRGCFKSSKSPAAPDRTAHDDVRARRRPAGGHESFIFDNQGKTTWNDPTATARCISSCPRQAKGLVQVTATAPGGMPIQRDASRRPGKPASIKVDFPIKPGETRIDVSYLLPFQDNGAFAGKVLYKGGPTRPGGARGRDARRNRDRIDGDRSRSPQANIYDVKAPITRLPIAGHGAACGRRAADRRREQRALHRADHAEGVE